MDRKRLGFKIKSLRKLKGLSQAYLEHQSGVSERSIQQIEAGKGNPGLEAIETLERILGADLVTLAGEGRQARGARDLPDAQTLAQVLPWLLAADPVRRAFVLFLLSKDQSFLDAVPELDRQMIEAMMTFGS